MNHALPQGFTSRPPRPDEIVQVYEFVRDCEIAEEGQPDETLSDVEEKWGKPGFNLETDAILVLAPDGEIAGYGFIPDHTKPSMTMLTYTGPKFNGQGIGHFLLDYLEERLSREIAKFDPTWQITYASWISANNHFDREQLESRGYSQVREFWQMGIVLTEPPAGPVWPEGIEVRPMVRGQDDLAIYEAYEETFSDHWGHIRLSFEEYCQRRFDNPKFDPSLWFLAIDNASGEIAGYSCCSVDDSRGWVNNLGVRRPYRRSGLGLALLRYSFQQLYGRGFPEVRLVVDGQSLTGATRLYTGAGMKPVMRFVKFEKIIRPGIDLEVKQLAG